MNFQRLLILLLIGGAVAACAPSTPVSELPHANVQHYKPEPTADAAHATIKGTYKEGSFFGRPTRATYVAAVDGKIDMTLGAETPVLLAPGPHALVIGYWIDHTQMPVTVRLEAKPGANYVVLQEDGALNLGELITKKSVSSYLYIVDEDTGEIVVPRTSDRADRATSYYAEPTGPNTASIRGTRTNLQTRMAAAYVASIDGVYVPTAPKAVFVEAQPNFEAAYRLEPGIRAIGIGLQVHNAYAAYPILLDVTEGASYVVRFEYGSKRIGAEKWESFTLWIEDLTNGAIIWPKTDVPIWRQPS